MAILGYFERKTRFLLGVAIVATVVSAALVVAGAAPVVTFGATALALAMLASRDPRGPDRRRVAPTRANSRPMALAHPRPPQQSRHARGEL